MQKRRTGLIVTVIITLGLLLLNWDFAFADTSSAVSSSTAATAVPAPTNQLAATTTNSTPATVPAMGNSTQNLPPVLDANGQQVSPGTLPTSPFYWLANIIQHIQLFLTFDPAQKVSLTEHQALQKLAAAREMVKEGKMDIAQKVMKDYTQNVTETQNLSVKLKDPNSQVVQNLETALAKADAANLPVLSQLLDRLPQQAAQQIAENVLKSMQKDVSKLSGDQKKKITEELNATSQNVDTTNLSKQTQTALVNFQQTLGIRTSADTGVQLNEDGHKNDNPATTTAVLNEDPNQSLRTVGEGKKTESANASDSKQQSESEQNKQEENKAGQPVNQAQLTVSPKPSSYKKNNENHGDEEKGHTYNKGHGDSEDD